MPKKYSTVIEYEGKVFSKPDAEEAAKHAERFMNWVKHQLPKLDI
jgi:HEPN domain-containing protein